MKFQIGIPDYEFKSGGVRSVSVIGQRGKDIPMKMVSMEEMELLHANLPWLRAAPAHAAYDIDKQRLWFHPIPNAANWFEVKGKNIETPPKTTETITLKKK